MEQHLNYGCSLSVSLAYVTCYNYAGTISYYDSKERLE